MKTGIKLKKIENHFFLLDTKSYHYSTDYLLDDSGNIYDPTTNTQDLLKRGSFSVILASTKNIGDLPLLEIDEINDMLSEKPMYNLEQMMDIYTLGIKHNHKDLPTPRVEFEQFIKSINNSDNNTWDVEIPTKTGCLNKSCTGTCCSNGCISMGKIPKVSGLYIKILKIK